MQAIPTGRTGRCIILTSFVDVKALLCIICVLRIHVECALPSFEGADLFLADWVDILEASKVNDRVTIHGMVVDLPLGCGFGLFPSIRLDLRVMANQVFSLLGDPFYDGL